ncbi:MAG: hypothetical protein N2441_09315 [Rhodocyclaceae bacterium]|nr:hypothetical protein [Rhodocyclaceae bacterium]
MSASLPASEQPALGDLESCRLWLSELRLTDPEKAHRALRNAIEKANCFPLAAETRLEILEALRETIYFLQGEIAKRFLARPLPLAPMEQEACQAVLGLWQLVGVGYHLCWQDLSPNGAQEKSALSAQRMLATMADEHFDRVRSGEWIGAHYWRRLYDIYRDIERLGLEEIAVADSLRRQGQQTPREAFVETLLFAAASPYELNVRQQGWVAGWARRFASKVSVSSSPPPLDGKALPLCLDLFADMPPGYLPSPGAGARWLDTRALRKSLKLRLQRLAHGGPDYPVARLGLGADCVQPACAELLRRIYPRWVKGGIRRRHERFPSTGACRLSIGFAAIHYYLAGRRIALGGQFSQGALLREREELALFDRLAKRFAEEYSRNQGFFLEDWQLVENWQGLDHSEGGLRLARSLSQPGARLSLGQLVALCEASDDRLLLGMIRWIRTTETMVLAGIERIPGRPQAVAVRATGIKAENEPYRPAFWLPVEQTDAGFLILAPGSFRPDKILELWDGAQPPRYLRLKALLQRGSDFEMVESALLKS